jgi:hypothetical protein
MRFWDASAIVPLLMTEPPTKTVQAIAEKDPTMIVWWATEVECASAVTRLERNAALDQAAATQAFGRLKHLVHAWHEVDPSDPIRRSCSRKLAPASGDHRIVLSAVHWSRTAADVLAAVRFEVRLADEHQTPGLI